MNGGSVAVRHRVEGPAQATAVVLSNSLGSDVTMWNAQVPALTSRFRVVRYDQRGHGASPVPPGPYTVADLGADVVALLDHLGLDRVHFWGVSLGGMVGMWLAVNAPDRVDRLVLCCTSAALGPPSSWRERAALVRAQGTEAVAGTVVGRWFTPALRARDPELVRRFESMLAATPAEGYAACCEAIAAMDLEADLSRIRAPTLVLAGARDPATPPEHAQRIGAAIRGSRVEVLADAAHLANVEQPDVVNALVLDHLALATGGRARDR